MFAKLVKHEFLATRRVILFVYLAAILLIGGNILTSKLDIGWLNSVMIFLLAVLGVGMIILTYVIVFFRYYKNLYGEEGYLTHTLPVKPSKLLAAKVLVGFVWVVISYILAAGVVLTIFYMVGSATGAPNPLRLLADVIQARPELKWAAAGLVVYMLLSALYLIAQVYFAISLGTTSKLQSLGIAGPIVVYFVTYFVLQLAGLAAMLIVPIGIRIVEQPQVEFWVVFESMAGMITNPDQPVIGLGIVVIILLAIPAFLVVTANLIRRHTSLK